MKITKSLLASLIKVCNRKLELIAKSRQRTASMLLEFASEGLDGEWKDPYRLRDKARDMENLARICLQQTIVTKAKEIIGQFGDQLNEGENPSFPWLIQIINSQFRDMSTNDPTPYFMEFCQEFMDDLLRKADRELDNMEEA